MKASSSAVQGMELLSQDEHVRIYDTGERTNCIDCGIELQVTMVILDFMGREKSRVNRQDICSDCITRREENAQKRQRMEQIKRLFDTSLLGPRFVQCTFDNWKPRHEISAALKICRDYASAFQNARLCGKGLVLMGGRGTGKTHLTAAIAAELMNQLYTVIFQPVPTLLKRIQATYRKSAEEHEGKLLSALTSCDLLILDDLGAEKWTEWMESTLYTIIDERYRQMLPVVVTTNCSMEELENQIGGRSFDRLVEICRFVRLEADSYRILMAKSRD